MCSAKDTSEVGGRKSGVLMPRGCSEVASQWWGVVEMTA